MFLLSLTNQATIEQVELNQTVAKQLAVLAAMGIEADGTDEKQALKAVVELIRDRFGDDQ